MAEILPPRIGSISDPNSGPQDQPAPKPRAKIVTAAKPDPSRVPDLDLSPAEDGDKHELDEMA
jgi:hypothetical protein